ncbi:MAG: VOC family protein [Alphaproteobacteria bacterium]|jgi:catechol 2,3-dioxygenase-like lactoylglutathione lyase family enzyme|nr:VOC family protein [Alphaproteobacteria bacterium]MDP6565890.1 VOC family protein [Alphaproteobacteria bacterium]MDP6813722.1 VOC family protein [Alphaproteobacteria bacterium]
MAISGINHLAFITDDLDGTIRFYRDLLGMTLEAGVGHDGYRHYFFRAGNTLIAFFAYQGAQPMRRKFHGSPTREPMGFDHVSFTVDSRAELFAAKDKLEAAGFEVTGAVDHGLLWSIYFFDPNNIPLEISWDIMAVKKPPAVADDGPLAIVAEGALPQPGHWPEVTTPTPAEAMTAHPGNGYDMQEAALREGRAEFTEEYRALQEATGKAAE